MPGGQSCAKRPLHAEREQGCSEGGRASESTKQVRQRQKGLGDGEELVLWGLQVRQRGWSKSTGGLCQAATGALTWGRGCPLQTFRSWYFSLGPWKLLKQESKILMFAFRKLTPTAV